MQSIDHKAFWSILDMRLQQYDRMLQPIEYVVSDRHQLIYLVNSKVACSSIKSAFLGGHSPDDHSIHSAVIKHNLVQHHLSDTQRQYYTFTFVRNPYDRLVSCYESKYHVDPVKYEGVSDFKHYLFGYLAEDEGFSEFVRKVCSIPTRLMDQHFRPQYTLVYDANGSCRCDFIGHYENLEAEYEPLRERFCLPPLPHLNRSWRTDWRDYYTEETLELVRTTFRNDFKAFGYADSP